MSRSNRGPGSAAHHFVLHCARDTRPSTHRHMLHPSREAYLLRALLFSLIATTREAERRQALGCSGTRLRASNVRPQAHRSRVTALPFGAPCVPRRQNLRLAYASGTLAFRRSTAAIVGLSPAR